MKCSPALAAWAIVQHDGTASGTATLLSHLHPSQCCTNLPAVVKDQEPKAQIFPGYSFLPLLKETPCLQLIAAFFTLFLPALQAAGG